MDHIRIRGAREHNLQGVDIDIPRDALVVITGISGSGKSSLAFDTVYQEGQRRFMESLSSYARQFLGQMDKPRVERVDGLSPTLSIDQKTVNRNPRSTVGTVTEILDHLRLLMARLGTPRCPECRREIATTSAEQIADRIIAEAPEARLHVMAPIVWDRKGEYRKELSEALEDGFIRARIDGEVRSLEEDIQLARYEKHTIELVVDRLRARTDRRDRLIEALETALEKGKKTVTLLIEDTHRVFSAERTCPDHGISIPELEPRLFSFNAPQGACELCQGLGYLEDFDIDLLIDTDAPVIDALTVLDGDTRLPFTTLSRPTLAVVCKKLRIDPQERWSTLDGEQEQALLWGAEVRYQVVREKERTDGKRRSKSNRLWLGIVPLVRRSYKWSKMKRLGAARRRVTCPDCRGKRLNPIALAVDFRGQNITTLTGMTIDAASAFFQGITLNSTAERAIGTPILRELIGRLKFLDQVGLGYLTIDRTSNTLSGGEAQRIRLAAQVGAGLQGVTYVLDEPSIGLHSRDLNKLLDALCALVDKGNTVLVVEHDAETMMRADHLIEVGPGAGREGGKVTASGPRARFLRSNALTAQYLRGERSVPIPKTRRTGSGPELVVRGATANNLADIDVAFPLGTFIAVTGVSGSGKSTLVMDILHRTMGRELHGATAVPGAHSSIDGMDHIDKIVHIDQAPIGRTPRSNPATYTGAWDGIRTLFAQVPESRARGYTKSRFSFNVAGGRCEECAGAGQVTIEMLFLSNVQVPCDACQGRRFNGETLEIRYRGRTIHEVLTMTVRTATAFFQRHRGIHRILATLDQVGLGYLALGQTSSTLSGGEAQRIKLASQLHRPATGRTLFLLDEPTTGLHMADIEKLLAALQILVDHGNTVIIIEHNTDVIRAADHIIDLGPEGGVGGGRVVATGTPEAIAQTRTATGAALALALGDATARASANRRPRRRKKQRTDITLRGVRTHNLQSVDVDFPKGAMTVVTGVSGSGKTSLAFHTLFAEGQRRYVESLSTYARRFLGRLGRAPIDEAEGLAPAIAIDQRNRSHNPRSTVATVTEVYDTLRLLYARIGQPHCPHCDAPVRGYTPSAGAGRLRDAKPGLGWLICTVPDGVAAADLIAEGFQRAWDPSGSGQTREQTLDDIEGPLGDRLLVVDRFDPARVARDRVADGIALAYGLGSSRAQFVPKKGAPIPLTLPAECEAHGAVLPAELTPRHFSFNSHVGACIGCDGLGRRAELDPGLIIPRPHRPLRHALDKRVGGLMFRSAPNKAMIKVVMARFSTPMDTPVEDFDPALRAALLYGLPDALDIRWSKRWGRNTTRVEEARVWRGIVGTVDQWRSRSQWLRDEAVCSACHGGRLEPALLTVRIGGAGIAKATSMTVEAALAFWEGLHLTGKDQTIADQAVRELAHKLRFLLDVGLGYLTLDRTANTLSGGETQRIRLATQLGARLTGTIYVLDEPTVGLHPRDTEKLLGTLHDLRDLGNTLVVVEHDPAVIRAADHIIDLGPGAGEHGGRIVATGQVDELDSAGSATGDFLAGRRTISQPAARRVPKLWIEVSEATVNNLKRIDVPIPRRCLTVVTGVSGSGKSSLVMDTLHPLLEARRKQRKAGPRRVVRVDQKPVGRTPRSTPATTAKVLTPIRELFSQTPRARALGYPPARFSFNHKAGRCPHCEGRGATLVEMHFLSDVWLTCEHCAGGRFANATLQVKWRDHTIADVLKLPVSDALELFQHHRGIARRLRAMEDVGLGYLRLGQPATTLSGGEAQRLKLATELLGNSKETCFLLDEPTTGLHFSDVENLVAVLHRLVDAGHMVVVIEHHLDVIRNADHIIDLGPEGGAEGGDIVVTGTPEEVAAHRSSWTGKALAEAFAPAVGGH